MQSNPSRRRILTYVLVYILRVWRQRKTKMHLANAHDRTHLRIMRYRVMAAAYCTSNTYNISVFSVNIASRDEGRRNIVN